MKIKLLILCTILSACGGSLTDEQRKKAKASIALNQIKKISDSQITDAAFIYGRSIALLLDKNSSRGIEFQDSLAQAFHVNIVSLHSDDISLSEKEKLLLDAYTAVTNPTDFSDNVQKINADSLLYTKPILKENRDGTQHFDYALGIKMNKKYVVLSIKN